MIHDLEYLNLYESFKNKIKEGLPLAFAGILEKSKFSKKWHLKKKIFVFGVNSSNHYPKKGIYKGEKSLDKLLEFLSGSSELVWDNTSTGKYRDCTRYNNPYKVSLYLSYGISVMVWN